MKDFLVLEGMYSGRVLYVKKDTVSGIAANEEDPTKTTVFCPGVQHHTINPVTDVLYQMSRDW